MARSICLYGATGSFKTTQVKFFAHYIARKTGKATLLMSADGGGWSACQNEVDAGMIRPYLVDSATAPLLVFRKLSQGYWLDAQQQLRPVDWSEIGGYAIEGWTSIGQAIMRYLPDRGINVGGEDRTKLGGFSQSLQVDGATVEEHFRSNTRGDYGFVQNQLYGLVMNFNSLPCDSVLYTALESKTEDDDKATVFGPSIAGKKATAQCGSWVGDLLHAQDYTRVRREQVPDPADSTGQGTMEQLTADMLVRIFYRKHPDPTTMIPFPAKPRIVPEAIAELEKRFPGGYFEPTTEWGIDRYLEAVDELGAASAGKSDTLRDWRAKMDAKLGRAMPAAAPASTTDAAATAKV